MRHSKHSKPSKRSKPLDIHIRLKEDQEGKKIWLENVKVNAIELVGSSPRMLALVGFVLCLLHRILKDDEIEIEKGKYSHRVWEAIRNRNPRIKWVKKLRRARLLYEIIDYQGEQRLLLKAPAHTIYVWLNGKAVTAELGFRDIFRRLSGLDRVREEIKQIIESAESFNNRKLTQTAVSLLRDALKFDDLSDELEAEIKCSLAKHLSHQGQHEEAIKLLCKTIEGSGVAERMHDNRDIWQLKQSVAFHAVLDELSLIVLRSMYQTAHVYRRLGRLDAAAAQIDQILEHEDGLKASRNDLLLMAKHLRFRVHEERLLKQFAPALRTDGPNGVAALAKLTFPRTDDDHNQLELLKELADALQEQAPRTPQRIAFIYQSLAEWSYYLLKPQDAEEYIKKAIDLFDEANDQRNKEIAQRKRRYMEVLSLRS